MADPGGELKLIPPNQVFIPGLYFIVVFKGGNSLPSCLNFKKSKKLSMKISKISVYQIDLPLKEGQYNWANGKSVNVFDSSIVRIETDEGIEGFGEVCPLGPFYLPAFGKGARAGIEELAPHLIGEDPLNIGCINEIMDRALLGHPYVKSPLDMACWDILGKVTGQPLSRLFGGSNDSPVALYRAISQDSPDAMVARVEEYRAEGYRKFQLKVGGDPQVDIERIEKVRAALKPNDILVADANTGWLMHDAMRVIRAVEGFDVYIEQPCRSYEECLSIRRKSSHPFILDETIDSIETFLRAYNDQAMDVINIKISKLGGLTKARQLRDLCVTLGIAMTIEDSWGGDIITAAIAHLAQSTPEKFRFSSTDFNSYVTVDYASDAPRKENGFIKAPTKPGLGVTPDLKKIGKPLFVEK